MSENIESVAENKQQPKAEEAARQPAPPEPVPPLPSNGKKKPGKKRKKIVKRIVLFSILAVVLGGVAYGMYRLFFVKPETVYPTATATFGPIEAKIYGSGTTKAKQSEDITVSAKGEVRDVFVKEGESVKAGTPLYSIKADSLNDDLDDAEKDLTDLNQQMDDINENIANLRVAAPFSGKAVDVSVKEGDVISSGQKLAVFIDDSRMRLKLYFSYAYENDIKPGMKAAVSIPSSMASVNATVEDVRKIRKITPEGTVLFEVTLLMNNPGTLTKDMAATASVLSGAGESMVPADTGKLEYYREADLSAKSSGTVSALSMQDYYEFKAGDMLLTLENDDYDTQAQSLRDQIAEAQKNADDIREQLATLETKAPFDGTVVSCSIEPGQTVEAGTVVMNVSNLSDMVIEAQVNEADVSKVSVGMNVTINQDTYDGQKQTMGVIQSVSMQGKNENGVSFFPVIVSIDNSDGSVMPGMSIWFEITAQQKDNCLQVPPQAIQNMPDGSMCVFVKSDVKPEKAVDTSQWPEMVPPGFYAVPVTVGISNETGVEIVDGITEGTEVFNEGDAGNQGMMGMYGGKAAVAVRAVG